MKIGSFAAIVIACFAVTPVFSQSAANSGSIYGKLLDTFGNPVNNVRVQLQSGIVAPVFTTTSAQGNFRFVQLPPGNYSLSIFHQGYLPINREGIVVAVGQQTQVDVVLEPTSNDTCVISGTIRNTNEVPLAGVIVTLESETVPQLQTNSGSDGSFQFQDLPAGKYILHFKKKGYQELEPQPLELSPEEVRAINIQMTAKLKQSKAITPVPKNSTEISWTYSADLLRTLPLSDSIYALLDHTPAVETNTFSTVHSDPGLFGLYAWVAARGADFYSNLWSYDGLNISVPDTQRGGSEYIGNFPSFFDLHNAEEVQIVTAGNDISLASPGITINVVSKQGGREWHGGGSFFYSDHNLQSSNTPEEVINDPRIFGSRTFLLNDLEEFNFNLGGPVIQNKLFIWGAYHHGRLDRFNLVDDSEGYKSTSYSLKANLDLSSAQKFQFSYFRADEVILFSDGGEEFIQPETILPGIWSVQYNWTPDPNTIVNAKYGYVGAGFQRDYSSEQAAHDITLELDKFVEGFIRGDHQLRFGWEYKRSGFRDLFYDDPESIYFITPNEEDPTQGSLDIAYPQVPRHSRINRMSFYANDSYHKGKLTVDLGLRLDRQTGKNEPRTIPSPIDVFGTPDSICSEELCFALGPGIEELLPPLEYPGKDPGITFDDLSPRIAISYDLNEDRSTRIYGGFSRYYQLYSGALLAYSDFSAPLSPLSLRGFLGDYKDSNQDGVITPDEVTNPILINFKDELSKQLYDSHLSNPYVNEYVIGVQTGHWSGWSVSAAITHRSYHDPVVGVPFGLTQDHFTFTETVVINTTIGDFEVPIYPLTGFTDNGTFILRTNKTFTQTYDSFEVFLQKQMAEKFFLSGGLVLQRQRAHNLSEGFPPWYFWPLNYFYSDPQLNYAVKENQPYVFIIPGTAVFGGAFPYSEWQLKFAGSYRLPWDMGIGAFLRYQQGIPFLLFGRLSNGSFFFPAFFNVEPYAARRNDDIFTLDLQLNKEFPLGDFGSLDLILEINNVTNSNPVLQRAPFLGVIEGSVYLPNNNFNTIHQYLSPRIFRLGVRYSF